MAPYTHLDKKQVLSYLVPTHLPRFKSSFANTQSWAVLLEPCEKACQWHGGEPGNKTLRLKAVLAQQLQGQGPIVLESKTMALDQMLSAKPLARQ